MSNNIYFREEQRATRPLRSVSRKRLELKRIFRIRMTTDVIVFCAPIRVDDKISHYYYRVSSVTTYYKYLFTYNLFIGRKKKIKKKKFIGSRLLSGVVSIERRSSFFLRLVDLRFVTLSYHRADSYRDR